MEKAIYKITNNLNGKIYIGQSVHPNKRWWEHCQRAKENIDSYPIHLAIKKYGEENFSFEILEWTEDYDNREKELIIFYNSLSPNGYNLASGGATPIMYGENHPRNTLFNEQVYNIINELKQNSLTDREIAFKYNTTDKIVSDINHGRTHKMENIQYPIRKRNGIQKLKEDEVKEIKKLLAETSISYLEIGKIFNVTKGTIYHINSGRTFVDKNIKYPIRKAITNESNLSN